MTVAATEPISRHLARALEAGLQARRQPSGDWLVSSATEAGVWHIVDVAHRRCSCKAGSFGNECQHKALATVIERALRGRPFWERENRDG